MTHRIEVATREFLSSKGDGLVSSVPIKVFNINSELNPAELSLIRELLTDPITEVSAVDSTVIGMIKGDYTLVDVFPKEGVTDPQGETINSFLGRKLGRQLGGVSFGEQFIVKGFLGKEDKQEIEKNLGNPLINNFRYLHSSKLTSKGMGFNFPEVNLPDVDAFTYYLTKDNLFLDVNTSNEDLVKISKDRMLELNLEEMQTIRGLFSEKDFIRKRKKAGLEAKLTDAEAELLAQSWSEHCLHKKFNAKWVYTSEDPNDKSGLEPVTDSLFKTIIQGSTNKILETFPYAVSLFKDNAGVIKLNEDWNLIFKVETHNHPSTLDPFGGANTGSGGVFRDPKHTGKGAWHIVSSQYGFRIPHPDAFKDLPPEILDSWKILEGVVKGVEDYGNKMGIPTMSGQVFVDPPIAGENVMSSWLKTVVYVGAVAVAPAEHKGKPTHKKVIKDGYIGLNLGGKVGKDGIHGATGSSTDLGVDAEKIKEINQSVQIGDPITEKKYFDAMTILLKEGLIEASQDCGAGGWNSAVSELAEICNGAEMDLSHVLEKYKGLTGWEKLISEAQERGVIVIKPKNLERVIEICSHFNVDATKIATFNNSGFYHVKDQDKTISFLPMKFLQSGLPQMEIKAHWKPCENKEPILKSLEDLTETTLNLIGSPNIQTYDWINTRFDHEVQGGSLIKPLVGIGRGKSDAIAYHPIFGVKEVAMETWGSNPNYGDIDAYEMGKNNVVDALGKVIAAGGMFAKEDNEYKVVFNGNTTCPKPEEDPVIAAKVLRMVKGASDAEIVFNSPTISGKDSTSVQRKYLSTKTGKEVMVKAKPELLISALAVLPDDSTLTTSDFKLPGDIIYVVGDTRDELGGSERYALEGEIGRNVPVSDLEELRIRYEKMHGAISNKLIHSAQYIERGGLVAALSNASIGGDLGIDVSIEHIDNGLGADKVLTSQTTGRFVVGVHPSKQKEFELMMAGQYIREIGIVTEEKSFNISYNGNNVVGTNSNILKEKNKGEIRLENAA